MIKVITPDSAYEILDMECAPITGWLLKWINTAEYVELVKVLYEDKLAHMFVDESGQVKNLPINKHATEIYLANAKKRKMNIPSSAAIHGTAVLLTNEHMVD